MPDLNSMTTFYAAFIGADVNFRCIFGIFALMKQKYSMIQRVFWTLKVYNKFS